VARSTPETEAWIGLWHVLTRGVIPTNGLSFHSPGGKSLESPRFFVPAPPTLVFDHRVGDELPAFDFAGAKVVVLTGVAVTDATRQAALEHARRGNTILSLPNLVPADIAGPWFARGAAAPIEVPVGQGRWIVTPDFLQPAVRQALAPHLPPEDEMRWRFGSHEVVFRRVDDNAVQVWLDGQPAGPRPAASTRVPRNAKRTLMREGK
jgi:hypothetical protein